MDTEDGPILKASPGMDEQKSAISRVMEEGERFSLEDEQGSDGTGETHPSVSWLHMASMQTAMLLGKDSEGESTAEDEDE